MFQLLSSFLKRNFGKLYSAELRRAFKGDDILGVFDDADEFVLPPGVGANFANFLIGDVAARGTELGFFTHGNDGISEPFCFVFGLFQYMQSQA